MSALIALGETSAQAETIRQKFPDARIVALTPLVDYWSERTGNPVIDIETLFDERAMGTLGADVIDRVEVLVGALDRLIQPFAARWPYGWAVSSAAFFHYLNSVLGGVVLRLEQVLAVYNKLAPQRVAAFRMGPYPFCGITSLDRSPWGLATRLVPMVAEARTVAVEWLDAPVEEPSLYDPTRAIAQGNAPAARAPEISWLQRLLRRARRFRAPTRGGGPLLVASLFSDLGEDILRAWERLGGRCASIAQVFPGTADPQLRAEFAAFCRTAAEHQASDQAIRDALRWEGIDLWPLLDSWLRSIVAEHTPALFSRAAGLWQKLIVEQAPQHAAVIAGGWVGDHYVIGRIADRARMPTVSIHYGGFIGYSLLPKHERFDLAECDYFICGGPSAARVLGEPSPQARWRPGVKRAQPVPTGMPWVERIVARRGSGPERSGGRRVMLVLNALLGDCRDLGFTFSPEIAYWQFTRKVVQRLAAEPGVEVLVKPPLRERYPQMPTPLLEWIDAQHYANVAVMPEIPLGECMEQADAFVIESPSTPLLHVVATDKPLLMYANRSDYLLDEGAASALKKRAAVFAQDEPAFFEGLESFLASGDWQAGPINDEFLREFAMGEGNAADSIARFIHRAIKKHRREDTNDLVV